MSSVPRRPRLVSSVPSMVNSGSVDSLLPMDVWADRVRSGGLGDTELVNQVRAATSKHAYDQAKKRLRCILPSLCAPAGALTEGLDSPHTGWYALDVDRKGATPGELQAAWEAAAAMSQTLLLHHSAGGTGLALIVAGPVAASGLEHTHIHRRIKKALPDALRAALAAEAQEDAKRLRASSHCPCLLYRPDAEPFVLDALPDGPDPALEAPARPYTGARDGDETRRLAERALAALPNPDVDYETWFRVILSSWSAGAPYEAVSAWSAKSGKHVERETRRTWDNVRSAKAIGPGTLFFLTDQHAPGWKPDNQKGGRRKMRKEQYSRINLKKAFEAVKQHVDMPVEPDGNGGWRMPGKCQTGADKPEMTLTVTYEEVPEGVSFPKMTCKACAVARLQGGVDGADPPCHSQKYQVALLRYLRTACEA